MGNLSHSRLAARYAARYQEVGLSPLPSKVDVKMPVHPWYTKYRDARPEFLPEDWELAGWTNIQLMTGLDSYNHKKIVVVDCDCPESEAAWAKIWRHFEGSEGPETWMVRSGGGGSHYYFEVFPSYSSSDCTSGMIWGVWDTWGDSGRGRWRRHQEVRILGHNCLVVAPPSLHVDNHRTRYRFEYSGYGRIPPISMAPEWLLRMPRLGAKMHTGQVRVAGTGPFRPAVPRGAIASFDRDKVLDSIPDKVVLARDWGLVFASPNANEAGWMSCCAVDREDRHPSASFSVKNGVYRDMRSGETLSLFDLGEALQVFPTWKDCYLWCESRFANQHSGVTRP